MPSVQGSGRDHNSGVPKTHYAPGGEWPVRRVQLSAGVECDPGKAFRQAGADSAEAAEKKSLRIAEDFSLCRVQMLLMKDGVVDEEY